MNTKILTCEDCGEEFQQEKENQWICNSCELDAQDLRCVDREEFPGSDFDYSMNY